MVQTMKGESIASEALGMILPKTRAGAAVAPAAKKVIPRYRRQ